MCALDDIMKIALYMREERVRFYNFCVQYFKTHDQKDIFLRLLTQEEELTHQYPYILQEEDTQAVLDVALQLLPAQYRLPNMHTLCDEMRVSDINLEQSVLIALGIEVSYIHICDILLKKCSHKTIWQEGISRDSIIDMLYRFEAVSYNHHIPNLQKFIEKQQTHTTHPYKTQAMTALFKNIPYQDIQQTFATLQTYNKQIKDIVYKLQSKQLSYEELTQFLEKINFSLVGGGIIGSFCAIIANNFLQKE